MRILVTGAGGFLGWHTRVRLHARSQHDVVPVDRSAWPQLADLARGIDAIVHIAGVNRGSDLEVERGNVSLARDVANAARSAGSAPRIVYANSIQSGNGTPYGIGKSKGAEVLAEVAAAIGSAFVDVRLPNLYGEHGRPQYNSFVATFAHAVARGETPQVTDRTVELLHVQDAAQTLIDALTTDDVLVEPGGTATTVAAVYRMLQDFAALYATGDIPQLAPGLPTNLFNTLRAAQFPDRYPIHLTPRSDPRGTLTEVVRNHGGQGQTFISTTKPGITRGEHFHLRKVERFAVVGGKATISLRKVLTDEVVSFKVTGDAPVAVDMPTMWVHNITNTGSDELTTIFWANELFNPEDPDTYPEPVQR
ncbi:NAD-dependent epimerase/dehydratase family protein [Isoptericola sp. b490]|uniref:polysaccharide biosynthesis C-terminal domain-containing protein n=1 Tax=Actinotalea lenta TaxID=3064654 RepID=UPI0027142DF0|nr:NAD-dependent epimerase/dehydratase family protein [Isoptericola sp. b490]MDO8119921.1 NAD-dependent epimerase/dehydratase family protein [Isoptericola sp. b490]